MSRLLVIAALVVSSSHALGEQKVVQLGPDVWRFESAEVAKSEPRKRPAGDAQWKRVDLPESWTETLPGHRGGAWYRMAIDLPAIPTEPYAIYLPNRRSSGMLFYVNGALVGSDVQTGGQLGNRHSPQFHVVPPAILRAGTNTVEIAMIGSSGNWAGLGRVAFGNHNPVRFMYRSQNNVENVYQYGEMFMMFALGLLGLALWLARRSDALAFWFALGSLVWSVTFAIRAALLGINVGVWNLTTATIVATITPIFTVVACLRAGGKRLILFESALWASFLATNLWMHLDPKGYSSGFVFTTLPYIYTGILVATAAWLLATQRHRLTWSLYVFLVAVILSVLFPLHDVLREIGVLDLDRASLRHFQAMDLALGIGAIVLERYLAATRATEAMNIELERRVAEKTVEIEDATRRMQAIRDEQALARERERILADMHDGVGASLVALAQVAEDESVGRKALAVRAKDALQDLRMAIDSLEPYEGDLATVLGAMRERLGQSVQAAGVKLEWAVADLPQMKSLTPSVVLDVQRVVYEAVTNAVRHADAATVKVSAGRLGESTIRVQVTDDGIGYDAAAPSGGRGLRNLRRRAERLGAKLSLASGKSGSTVTLDLPMGEEPPAFPAVLPQLQQA